jgi:hypothetical protein
MRAKIFATDGSSSMTKIRALGSAALARSGLLAGGICGEPAPGVEGAALGNGTRKIVPTPGGLVNEISPPMPRTIAAEIERPNPMPTPTSFVVKNGSKTRA